MPAYRAYFLDEDDHITGTEIIETTGLRAAVDIASRLLQSLPQVPAIELWQGERPVCALPPSVYAKRAREAERARRSERSVSRQPGEPIDMNVIRSRLAAAREHLSPGSERRGR